MTKREHREDDELCSLLRMKQSQLRRMQRNVHQCKQHILPDAQQLVGLTAAQMEVNQGEKAVEKMHSTMKVSELAENVMIIGVIDVEIQRKSWNEAEARRALDHLRAIRQKHSIFDRVGETGTFYVCRPEDFGGTPRPLEGSNS